MIREPRCDIIENVGGVSQSSQKQERFPTPSPVQVLQRDSVHPGEGFLVWRFIDPGIVRRLCDSVQRHQRALPNEQPGNFHGERLTISLSPSDGESKNENFRGYTPGQRERTASNFRMDIKAWGEKPNLDMK